MYRLLPAAFLAVAPGLGAASPDQTTSKAPAPGATAYLKDGRSLSLFAESSEHVPVARVGDDVIAMRELADALATAHRSHAGESHAQRRDAQVILDRLVDLRLITLEARSMGIADLPQHKAQVETFRATALRDVLKEGYTRDLRPDPDQVEKVFRDVVREWKVRSLLFTAEADARELAERVKGGALFEVLAAEAVAQKKARGSGQSDLLPEKKVLPEVLAELRKLKPGQVSPVVKVASGFAVVLLEAQQFPENPEQLAAARWTVLQARHNEELVRQYQLLRKKYARVDGKLIKKLDFEAAKPGIEGLLRDKRALVRIEGEKAVTVADLATEIRNTYFHGGERAARSKKPINLRKESSLDNLLGRRLFLKEALARKVQDTPAFRYRCRTTRARSSSAPRWNAPWSRRSR
jgi:parvulin-like peptidyl-prolyl isomerase